MIELHKGYISQTMPPNIPHTFVPPLLLLILRYVYLACGATFSFMRARRWNSLADTWSIVTSAEFVACGNWECPVNPFLWQIGLVYDSYTKKGGDGYQ